MLLYFSVPLGGEPPWKYRVIRSDSMIRRPCSIGFRRVFYGGEGLGVEEGEAMSGGPDAGGWRGG